MNLKEKKNKQEVKLGTSKEAKIIQKQNQKQEKQQEKKEREGQRPRGGR